MSHRRFTSVSLAAAIALMLAACSSASTGTSPTTESEAMSSPSSAASATAEDKFAAIKERGVMNVGVVSYPPYSFFEKDEFQGFLAEMLVEYGKELGLEMVPVPLTSAAFIPAINSGRVDTLMALSYTEERAKEVLFNSEGQLYFPDCMFTKEDSGINTLEDLNGKVLGLTRASYGETLAQNLIKAGAFTPSDIKTYDTYDAPIQDILAGRIDAGVWDVIGADYAKLKNPDYKINCFVIPPQSDDPRTGWAYWLLPKDGSTETAAAFDAATLKFREDGTFERIMAKWGVTNPVVWLGPEASGTPQSAMATASATPSS